MASTTPRFAGSPLTSRPPLLRSRRAPRRRPLLLEALEQLVLPSTVTVSNYNDSGPGSLRAAILQVEGTTDATVNVPSSLDGDIYLNSPLLITKSVKISGPDENNFVLTGHGAVEVFDVELGQTGTVSISGLGIQDKACSPQRPARRGGWRTVLQRRHRQHTGSEQSIILG